MVKKLGPSLTPMGKPPPMAARLEKALPFRRAITASYVGVGIGIGIGIVPGDRESLLGLESRRSMSIPIATPIPIPTPNESKDRAA